jgi:putative DNA methylase
MGFGNTIRRRRQSLALSLRKAAKLLGCDAAYLSRIESEKTVASDELITKLARVLGTDEQELFLAAGRLPASLRPLVTEQSHEVMMAIKDTLNAALEHACQSTRLPATRPGAPRAIDDGFPFEAISDIAEAESWRKEIYRPIYHVHKWWAQRLGSVFRAAIIAAAVPRGSSVLDYFRQPVSLAGLTVYDPFMGSGTTVGEAHKLGCTAIGRDINPVAYRTVRTALGPLNRRELEEHFEHLSRSVAPQLQRLYQAVDSQGMACDVLYYFWVKTLPCPKCNVTVDLFPRYIFTRHADRTRDVPVHVVCPGCGDVFPICLGDASATCAKCHATFNPHEGPAKHTTAVCNVCGHEFRLAATARAAGHPPAHRMYAKLVLRSNGAKVYLPITGDDLAAFEAARQQLKKNDPLIPRAPIEDGWNTKQILNYGYGYWHELFNDRQLLGLTLLAQAIAELPKGPPRDALALLFSGTLEFNNMFASYKGEGTGAVRHMFSHHVLKPERMPIEANLWGTPQSSGAFSTLYRSRLLRAVGYREAPFEIAIEESRGDRQVRKVFHLSPPMGGKVVNAYPHGGLPQGAIYVSCGSSAKTDIPDKSVDLVVTDPPFFDNVHYSELADFFHVWQELYFFGKRRRAPTTTRHEEEVQDTNAIAFAEKLMAVFVECHRVLRNDGRLVFSYHHSREDGWASVARAVVGAGFSFIQSQPVKSEMSVAAPKSQAKEPIDLDMLLVCKKRKEDQRPLIAHGTALTRATSTASNRVARFNRSSRRLSRNDVRVILLGQLLVELSPGRDASEIVRHLDEVLPQTKDVVEQIWGGQEIFDSHAEEDLEPKQARQFTLFK